MKGILLAGGRGTRLYPLTRTVSKQLLPVYDKPMIYYPLSTLMLFGIRDILIISTPEDKPRIEQLLGDGGSLGLKLSYAVQEEPKGIAQALLIGKDFIKDDQVCLILGDNIFYMGEQLHQIVDKLHSTDNNFATIFAYHVSNPQRFGVVEFNSHMQVISIEEKPQRPKSNYVSVGLYFYPPDAAEKAASLKPSKRGELEITDLNNLYLKESRLSVIPMLRGNAWLDAGTPESLMDSGDFVRIIEQRQGLKIACLEEIALKQGFINKQQLLCLIERLDECNYKTYLQKVYLDELEIY
ncbi:glucose-1-phosphate thymidylyltransferase RfbA [Anaerobiospirillum succiniciproducens]|uniref:glucose-1-phosphate thymidylyltransferase RfbA n=1 Tax=Anaerobiospirillum succiniciproducens TaxID=13335 RepID=UPI0023528E7D|nr:glucose-1-phosphate thymidylyltransferase RfbA [Anaerobiospirillum succiniciproducens]MCI6862778.1 glucose-1-phosphate thymidylyltransferase RfbA [Anaerobiospirillum succiniciproducens]